jgi:PRC-barrel domain
MDHPRPGFKYVNAKDLDDSGKKFSGLDVDGVDGAKLGEVEGFVMDVEQGRPRHVAVAAGWFIHKHFLIPIGHVSLNDDGTKLVADITKERVERFPGFDKSEFEQLDRVGLARLDATMAAACASDRMAADARTHYDIPAWWQDDFYRVPAGDRRR